MRSVLAALLAGALLVATPASPVVADELAGELADARAETAAAEARVSALQPRVERALRAYESALGGLAHGVSASVVADQEADAAATAAAAARALEQSQVRALYMSGGGLALVATVLDAPTAGEALHRMQYVTRLVERGSEASAALAEAAEIARDEAARLELAADRQVLRASDVVRRYEELAATLAQAQAEVAALSERARGLAEAQALLARIAALNATVDAAGAQRVATASVSASVPPLFARLYRQAAKSCRGLHWSVLFAIGQVESGHGANPGTSYAGARGPMQFMPATFAAYGTDGDGDGDVDIDDPADSVFSAARYLCANGAGRGQLEGAIWNYNHAQWYVDLVLKLAGQYAAREAG